MKTEDYILDRMSKRRRVKIEIIARNSNGYLEMDWLIDNKFLLTDMPSEIFEGEEMIELKKKQKGEDLI